MKSQIKKRNVEMNESIPIPDNMILCPPVRFWCNFIKDKVNDASKTSSLRCKKSLMTLVIPMNLTITSHRTHRRQFCTDCVTRKRARCIGCFDRHNICETAWQRGCQRVIITQPAYFFRFELSESSRKDHELCASQCHSASQFYFQGKFFDKLFYAERERERKKARPDQQSKHKIHFCLPVGRHPSISMVR